MFTDNDEPQWTLKFLTVLSIGLGTPPLAFGYWIAFVLPVSLSYPGYMRSKCQQILVIESIAGVLLLTALALELFRKSDDESRGWISRSMGSLPLFSVYPHLLRWAIGIELSLCAIAIVLAGINLLHVL